MAQRVDATNPGDREGAIVTAENAVKGGRLIVMPTEIGRAHV